MLLHKEARKRAERAAPAKSVPPSLRTRPVLSNNYGRRKRGVRARSRKVTPSNFPIVTDESSPRPSMIR